MWTGKIEKKNVCIKEKFMKWSDNEACLVSWKLRRPKTWSAANLLSHVVWAPDAARYSFRFIHCLLNSFPVPQSSCCRFSLLSVSNLIMSPSWAGEPVPVSVLGATTGLFPCPWTSLLPFLLHTSFFCLSLSYSWGTWLFWFLRPNHLCSHNHYFWTLSVKVFNCWSPASFFLSPFFSLIYF